MTSGRRVVFVFVLCLFSLLGAELFSVKPILAATPGVSLTTSPVSFSLPIKPGTSSTQTLHLLNNGSQPLLIDMELDIFGSHGTSGQASIFKPPSNDVSATWVRFSPSSFIAQPGVWSSVKMTIQLPLSASLGYYYAVIFHPNVPNPKLGHLTSVIKGSNAILVLVDTQSSNESHQAQIATFSISKHIYEYLPATFTVTIHNTGNIYIAPSGNIFISKNSNLANTIGTLDINSAKGNILPDSNRVFTATWTSGFPVFVDKKIGGQVINDKQGKPIEQLQWNFSEANKFRFGEYYAQVALVYNNGTRTVPLTGVVSFWVIPWKLMSLGFLILLLLGLGVWSLSRSLLRRIRKVRKGRKIRK